MPAEEKPSSPSPQSGPPQSGPTLPGLPQSGPAATGDGSGSDPQLQETRFLPQSPEALNERSAAAAGGRSGPAMPSAAEADWVGRTLGKYRVSGILGQGGMGIVLRAHDPMIERDVAIKLMPEELAEDEKTLQRFLAEAKAAGRINHANVVSIYEVGQADDAYYLVMELVPGGSVAAGLGQQRAYSVLGATRIVIDAAKGLSAAHAAGLVHRDIKPANLLKAADGSVKITDFGLVKTTSSRTHTMTQAGTVVGTPYFMSPEQCDGKPVDARSDIYSLGATYYSLLTGKNPYEDSDSVLQVMFKHCRGEIPDPQAERSSVPSACSAIIARAMAKAPADRYQSADEMLADLQAVAATLSGEVRIELPSQSDAALAAVPGEAGGTGATGAAARRIPQPMRLKSPRRWWIVAATAAAAVVLLVAAWWAWLASPKPSGAAAGVAGESGQPIRVGVLHSISGTMAGSETVVVDATLLAIEHLNAAGGVLGRRVEPIVVDTRSDPDTFAREAERLITEEQVVTLFGCWTSASRKAVKEVVEQHDHLLIYPLQYEGVEESPNIVYMGSTPNQQVLPAIDWAIENLGHKRFFLAGSDYVYSRVVNAIIGDFLHSKGATVVGQHYLPLGSHDAAEMVKAIEQSDPEMILNTINGDSNIAFYSALRSQGITPETIPTLSFSIAEQELRSLGIDQMQNEYAAWTYFQSLQNPVNERFVQQFHERYPQRVISDPMESAYVGVQLWAKAVAEAESLQPTKIRRAMLTQRIDAPSGPVRIDADTQHVFKTPKLGQAREDGQFEVLWTAPAPLRPVPFPESRPAADWKIFLHDLHTLWGNRWAAPLPSPAAGR